MDGELEEVDLDRVYAHLKRPDGMATWVSYHVIGDALRGASAPAAGFCDRFATRLAAEPTVLAPRAAPTRPVTYAWAAAAGIAAIGLVGWVAVATWQPDSIALAKAGEAVLARAPQGLKPQAVPADYLLVHHEYSPTTPIQGVGPYFNAVAAPGPDVRR